MTKQKSFIFIGRSGCGKGTQAQMLMDYLKQQDPERKILYVQTGAEYREFMKGTSFTAEKSKRIFETGGLVPEFLAIHFWTHRIVTDLTEGDQLVLDGLPRRYHEAVVLDSLFGFYGITHPEVVYLNVSEEWSRSRLSARGRVDDTRTEIANRLSWFETDVMPTIEYYKKNSAYSFHDIDGERPISEIYNDIRAIASR